MKHFTVVGLMSGTSLDGVDVALCTFIDDGGWKYELLHGETIKFDAYWKDKLLRLHLKSAEEFAFTHAEFGRYLGNLVKDFLGKNNKKADFVASHGHTVFHQPERHFTSQIGDGAAISAACSLPVVSDFRTLDVALGGQGAPLVPVGDKLLFGEFEYCLNLGGIANISFEEPLSSPSFATKAEEPPGSTSFATRAEGKRIAFDVCPCNLVLNSLASVNGKEFDEDGLLAASGKVDGHLLDKLNTLGYYKRPMPKSLGREDIEKDFLPLLRNATIPVEDKLRTFCEHIAIKISSVAQSGYRSSPSLATKAEGSARNSPSIGTRAMGSTLLITGGGAFNKYLISRIEALSSSNITIPERALVAFKEALIFAFLGVLRWKGEVNCLKSVTGASRDSVGGAIYGLL